MGERKRAAAAKGISERLDFCLLRDPRLAAYLMVLDDADAADAQMPMDVLLALLLVRDVIQAGSRMRDRDSEAHASPVVTPPVRQADHARHHGVRHLDIHDDAADRLLGQHVSRSGRVVRRRAAHRRTVR